MRRRSLIGAFLCFVVAVIVVGAYCLLNEYNSGCSHCSDLWCFDASANEWTLDSHDCEARPPHLCTLGGGES